MSASACDANLPLEALVDYWADHGATDESLEEHIYACDACSARLAWIAAVGEVMPAVLERRGGRRMTLTAQAIDHLARRGVRLRHYHFPADREIACTVALDDDLVVSWIPVDLADDEELAGVMVGPDDVELLRFHDAAVDRDRNMLILAGPAEQILRLPDIRLRLRLTATGPRGLRDLGEYIYNHTAPR